MKDMIERKKKRCKTCDELEYIWAYGNCKNCAGKLKAKESNTVDLHQVKTEAKLSPVKKRTPIAKVSDKQKKLNALYSLLKTEHMKHKHRCEAMLDGCQLIGIDIHHLYFGKDRKKHFLDSSSWLTVCRSCHSAIHDKLSNDELINLGLRLIDYAD